jgi:hypothetical protein
MNATVKEVEDAIEAILAGAVAKAAQKPQPMVTDSPACGYRGLFVVAVAASVVAAVMLL